MVPPLYLALRGVTEGGNQRLIILMLAACMGTGMTGMHCGTESRRLLPPRTFQMPVLF